MGNVHKGKRTSKERSVFWWLWVLLVLGFTAGLAVDAGAEYSRDNATIPTDADLRMETNRSKTLVIRLLNLTPYDVVEDTVHNSAMTSIDRNRNTPKSGMFAPVGWPAGTAAKPLRGLHGAGPTNGWSQIPGTNNWLFTPDDTNASAHPYNFVVSWADHGGHVTKSEIGWTIKGVYAAGHGQETKNVPLRMWFTRNDPPTKELYSDLYGFVSACIIEAVDLIGVCIDPMNPIAWLDAFVASKELAKSTFENFNGVDTEIENGEQMYFAAYVIPDGTVSNPDCVGCKPTTITKSSDGTTDGVDVQWASETGSYSDEIIVTTNLLRGKNNENGSVDTGFYDYRVPIVSVTLWTPEQYAHSGLSAVAKMTSHPLGASLRAALGTRDLSKYTQFASLYKSLNKSQRQTLREAIQAFLRDNSLTNQQVVLVEKIIAAMQKGQIKLSPDKR